MSTAWSDTARTEWADYQRVLSEAGASTAALAVRERSLAGMVPRLLEEIAKRDMLLTRVRSLLGSECGLYDLPDDHLVPVHVIRAALDNKEANRG